MNQDKELEQWLDTVSEKVRRNVQVVTPPEVGQDFLLHISTNTNIRKFVPFIGRRQAASEDRSVPRITVAPSLLGCLIGYAKADWDFKTVQNTAKPADGGYKGGWKIYSLDFEAALLPNTRMVYDQKASDEHWLVSYNLKTNEYYPRTAGKMFYRSMRLIARNGKDPYGEIELYVEVIKTGGLLFSKNHHLDPGYYRIVGPGQQHVRSWQDDSDYEVRPIDRAEYYSAKNASADLLGLTEGIPPHLEW